MLCHYFLLHISTLAHIEVSNKYFCPCLNLRGEANYRDKSKHSLIVKVDTNGTPQCFKQILKCFFHKVFLGCLSKVGKTVIQETIFIFKHLQIPKLEDTRSTGNCSRALILCRCKKYDLLVKHLALILTLSYCCTKFIF